MKKLLLVGLSFAVLGGLAGFICLHAQLVPTGTAATAPVEKPGGKEPPAITLRKFPEQVVLYTLYRGDYAGLGQPIGKLFMLAGQKGLMPPQGMLTLAYLNNPLLVAKPHYLTELRLPVSKDALKQAGALGEFTDIKQMPALEVAVIVKPAGMADPAPLYAALQNWIVKNGYCMVENPMEQVQNTTPGGNYAQMQAEIMVPVAKPQAAGAGQPNPSSSVTEKTAQ